jgi:outer membrane murein-binding lipoprotein Lpp
MDANNKQKIGEVASDLDDLATTVDELETDQPSGATAGDVKKLRHALEDASDAADAIDEQLSNPTGEASRDRSRD